VEILVNSRERLTTITAAALKRLGPIGQTQISPANVIFSLPFVEKGSLKNAALVLSYSNIESRAQLVIVRYYLYRSDMSAGSTNDGSSGIAPAPDPLAQLSDSLDDTDLWKVILAVGVIFITVSAVFVIIRFGTRLKLALGLHLEDCK